MTVKNLPASIGAIVQDGTLIREFQDALSPNLVYRKLYEPESVPTGLGEKFTKTRTALLPVVTAPLAAASYSDQDSGMTPKTAAIEQYTLQIKQYGDTVDTHMLSSDISLASTYLRNAKLLGIQSGMSLDRLARGIMFDAYLGGNSRVTTTAASGTAIDVDDVRGFQFVSVNGVLTPVSGGNPMNITINGVANTVTGVTPGSRNANGQIPGTLTVGTAVAVTAGWAVLAGNRPRITRVGGGATANNITSTDLLTLQSLIDTAAQLRNRAVPAFDDGTYMCALDSLSVAQLFQDTAFRQVYQGQYGSSEYKAGQVFKLAGMTFVETSEAPTMTFGSVTVRMPIVAGAGAGIEGRFAGVGRWLDEFGPGANGAIMMSEDAAVAMIARAPLDRLQQVVSNSWSAILDWTIPTDLGTSFGGSAALYKRAQVIQHGS
jgi:hypothetical protein